MFPGTPAFQLAGDDGRTRLLSALGQPRWPQRRTVQEKAAALHYSLNKNHPYVDGNKRLAVTAMEFFLLKNGFVLYASGDELVDFALHVAENRWAREESAEWLKWRAFRMTWSEERARRWLRSLPPEHAAAVEAWMRQGQARSLVSAIVTRFLHQTVLLAEDVGFYTARSS